MQISNLSGSLRRIAFAAGIVVVSMVAPATAAVLTLPGSGVSIGVNSNGSLINSGVGLFLPGVGDALTPGCECESWGVKGNGVVGYAGQTVGVSNITVDSFTGITATTAVSTTHLTSLPALQVVQSYAPSASPDLFENTVTLTNLGGATITDVQFARAMDWDVPPTEFDEFVTIIGNGASALIGSGDNGFATPFLDGLSISCPANTDFVDCGPDDHGAYFIFAFGDLAPGASKTFSIFYGASVSQAAALASLAAVDAEVYSFGQSNTIGGPTLGTPGTYTFGFSGVGGPPVVVPEPSSFALLATGLAGAALFRKRLFKS